MVALTEHVRDDPSPRHPPPRPPGLAEALRVRIGNIWLLLRLGLRHFRSLPKTMRAFRVLERERRALFGDGPIRKLVRAGDRYFWDPTAPGYPSRAVTDYYRRELNGVFPFLPQPGLRIVYLSVTKKCTLHCRHCYEWQHLHQPERLSREDLIAIVRKFQDYGVGVFYLEGGEPLQRLADVCALLAAADDRSDFWIITSGLGLTAEKARRLKHSGLTGVAVSLDDWRPERHNDFRGNEHTFDWAMRAVAHARAAGLVTSLSLCTTREFVTPANLEQYMMLARCIGVSFVQWLEPRAEGRFAGQDVDLSPEQQDLLEDYYRRYNLDARYRDFPLVLYPAHLQRLLGCPGSGLSYLYVDSDGAVSPCPFCQQPVGSALELPAPDLVRLTREVGCRIFPEMSVNELTVGG